MSETINKKVLITGLEGFTGRYMALEMKSAGYQGRMEYDTSKPNGMPRKLMDANRIRALGWSPSISLEQGISDFYGWYCR